MDGMGARNGSWFELLVGSKNRNSTVLTLYSEITIMCNEVVERKLILAILCFEESRVKLQS